MSKLRLVTPRDESNSSEDDIRGLGASHLFDDNTPLPFLGIHRADHDRIKKIADTFGLDVHEHGQRDHVFLTDSHHGMNHKEKSVVLFVAALAIAKKCHDSKILLGWENRLRNSMLQAMPGTSEHPKLKEDLFNDWIRSDAAILGLCQEAQLTLNQSGVPIIPSENILGLSGANIDQLANHVSTLNTLNKVAHFPARKVG